MIRSTYKLEESLVSSDSILSQARALLALSGENEARAEGLYAELIGLYHDQFRDEVFAGVADEITRLVESDIALQKTRTSLLGALSACLKSSSQHEVAPVYIAQAADPILRSYTGIALDASLNEVDLDALDDDLHQEPPVKPTLAMAPEKDMIREAERPNLHRIEPSPNEEATPSVPGALEAYDPWGNLNIRDLHASGAPEPLPPLPEERVVVAQPVARSSVNQYLPPEPHGTAVNELERALDSLLSQPPKGIEPPEVEHQAGDRSGISGSLPGVSVSAVIQTGARLVSSRALHLGAHAATLSTWEPVPSDEPVHVFFELPNGAQLGVNCRVAGAKLAPSIHGKYTVELEYLDLSPADRALLISGIAP